MTPLPHQLVNAKRLSFLLRNRFCAADQSATGTGKTVTALLAIEDHPFVVVCTKSTVSFWRRTISEMKLEEQCLHVSNYEQFKLGKTRLFRVIGKQGGEWIVPQGTILIFDEAHKSRNGSTQNASLLRIARRQGLWLLVLSATLIPDVLALSGLAYPLRLVDQQKYWPQFAKQYGLGLNHWHGYEDQSKPWQRRALHLLLDRCGVRTSRESICLESAITRADLIDAPNVFEISQAYQDLKYALEELCELEAQASTMMVERLRGRQRIELLKVPAFVDELVEHLAGGCKVVLFLNFTESIEAAESILGERGIRSGIITGVVTGKHREEILEEFNFRALDVMLVNIQAGGEGVSMHDSDGRKPRVALLSPPEGATTLLQALGRIGGRLGAKSVGLNRILFVAGTTEESVYENVRNKINRLESIRDNDLTTALPRTRDLEPSPSGDQAEKTRRRS